MNWTTYITSTDDITSIIYWFIPNIDNINGYDFKNINIDFDNITTT